MTTPTKRKRCKATAKSGKRCKRQAIPPTAYCHVHAAADPPKKFIERVGPYIGAASGIVAIIKVLLECSGFLNQIDREQLSEISAIASPELQTSAYEKWLQSLPFDKKFAVEEIVGTSPQLGMNETMPAAQQVQTPQAGGYQQAQAG